MIKWNINVSFTSNDILTLKPIRHAFIDTVVKIGLLLGFEVADSTCVSSFEEDDFVWSLLLNF